MRVRADAVRDVRQEVKGNTNCLPLPAIPVSANGYHQQRMIETAKRTEQLQHIQWFMFHHHLVRHSAAITIANRAASAILHL